MAKTDTSTEIHIVIQFGGSSGEQYSHVFRTERKAFNYIKKAERASYRCLGPFPIALPEVKELSDAAQDALVLLRTSEHAEAPQTKRLDVTIDSLRKQLLFS